MLNLEQVLAIVDKVNSGKTYREIATEYGVSRVTIAGWAKKLKDKGYVFSNSAGGARFEIPQAPPN